jgi:hypothetical protein
VTDEEVKAAIVTLKLHGEPISLTKVVRSELVNYAIKKTRPVPIFKCLDICPLREVGKALGKDPYVSHSEAFALLRVFHCVGWFSIPRQVRRRIPDLIREVLKGAGE